MPDPKNRSKTLIDIDSAFEIYLELYFKAISKVFSNILAVIDI